MAVAQIFFSSNDELRVIQSGDIEIDFFGENSGLVGGLIYWSETAGSGSEIKRSNLDGTVITVVVDQNSAIRGLAFDLENDMLYWVDLTNDGKIYRADLYGENIETAIEYHLSETAEAIMGIRGICKSSEILRNCFDYYDTRN